MTSTQRAELPTRLYVFKIFVDCFFFFHISRNSSESSNNVPHISE